MLLGERDKLKAYPTLSQGEPCDREFRGITVIVILSIRAAAETMINLSPSPVVILDRLQSQVLRINRHFARCLHRNHHTANVTIATVSTPTKIASKEVTAPIQGSVNGSEFLDICAGFGNRFDSNQYNQPHHPTIPNPTQNNVTRRQDNG